MVRRRTFGVRQPGRLDEVTSAYRFFGLLFPGGPARVAFFFALRLAAVRVFDRAAVPLFCPDAAGLAASAETRSMGDDSTT
jgi:hypothetical protein